MSSCQELFPTATASGRNLTAAPLRLLLQGIASALTPSKDKGGFAGLQLRRQYTFQLNELVILAY